MSISNIPSLVLGFVHPTKTGGTTVEEFFQKHYKDYITGRDHGLRCGDYLNPVVIFREPYQRILSIYKYFEYGSKDIEKYRPKKQRGFTFDQFLDLLSSGRIRLYFDNYFYDEHVLPQYFWYNTDFKNIVVIKYKQDLNQQLNKLFSEFFIPKKHIDLPHKNISAGDDIVLTLEQKQRIQKLYKPDFILMDTIQNNPQAFRAVID